VKVDYYLSNAAPETPLWQFARVAKAEHRIEDCIQGFVANFAQEGMQGQQPLSVERLSG